MLSNGTHGRVTRKGGRAMEELKGSGGGVGVEARG